MSEKFHVVYRSTNPVEAEIIENVLREEGFAPRLIGTRTAALIGVSDLILKLRIEVSESEFKDALELVQTLQKSGELDPVAEKEPDAGDYDADDDAADGGEMFSSPLHNERRNGALAVDDDSDFDDAGGKAVPVKRRIVAAGISFVFPGGAHFYLGRKLTGTALLCYLLAGFVLLFKGESEAGAIFFTGAILMDLLITQLTFPKPDSMKRMPLATQLVLAIFTGAILAGIGYLLMPPPWHPTVPSQSEMVDDGSRPAEQDTELLQFNLLELKPGFDTAFLPPENNE